MEQIKIRVLNTIGVAIGAIDAEPIAAIARPTSELGGRPVSPLTGGASGALSRILISWTAVSPKARPIIRSDNLGTVLARAEDCGVPALNRVRLCSKPSDVMASVETPPRQIPADEQAFREPECTPHSIGRVTIALIATRVLILIVTLVLLGIHGVRGGAARPLARQLTWDDGTTIAAIAIFAATYLVSAIGKLPGYQLDRAGAALLSASLMVG